MARNIVSNNDEATIRRDIVNRYVYMFDDTNKHTTCADSCHLGWYRVDVAALKVLPDFLSPDDRTGVLHIEYEFDSIHWTRIGRKRAMPDVAQVLEAQQRVVREVVACVTDLQDGSWDAREWERIAIDVEIETNGGRRISAQTSVIARRPGQPLEDLDFRLSVRAKDALVALRETMRDDRGAWSTCRFRVDRDGRFEFDFSHEPPRRLGGDLLYSPLQGHLDRYLAEAGKR